MYPPTEKTSIRKYARSGSLLTACLCFKEEGWKKSLFLYFFGRQAQFRLQARMREEENGCRPSCDD